MLSLPQLAFAPSLAIGDLRLADPDNTPAGAELDADHASPTPREIL